MEVVREECERQLLAIAQQEKRGFFTDHLGVFTVACRVFSLQLNLMWRWRIRDLLPSLIASGMYV